MLSANRSAERRAVNQSAAGSAKPRDSSAGDIVKHYYVGGREREREIERRRRLAKDAQTLSLSFNLLYVQEVVNHFV